MQPHRIKYLLAFLFAALCAEERLSAGELSVRNRDIEIRWRHEADGWKITRLLHRGERPWGIPDGSYTIIRADEKPSAEPETILNRTGDTMRFDIERFRFIAKDFNRSISSVPMNRAGHDARFYPQKGWKSGDTVHFEGVCTYGRIRSSWTPDPDYPGDIRVELRFEPAAEGYYSLCTPTLAVLPEERLGWSVVPGFFQGDRIQPVFHLAYMYGQGLPHLPVVCNDNTVTTMISSMTEKDGCTLGLIPDPGFSRPEYGTDRHLQGRAWRCGLSHMNRGGELSPTLYHPVLGEEGSQRSAGEPIEFRYRVSMSDGGWYDLHKHTAEDIYGLESSLALKHTTIPLYKRMEAIRDYILDDSLSHWRTADCHGVTIGAQAYLGGVVGADRDAMKNSDIGAAWMLASMTDDPRLTEQRLPQMRNFKLMQQAPSGDPNHGAAMGQYYLSKSGRFVEEWGDHIEPIGIAYYTLMDLGNILLFEPGDTLLRESFRAGAERLLSLQQQGGGFVVAYDKHDGRALFTDLKDLRPTFYGFIVAYRILGERKYLDAAVRGAEWFIRNAVDRGAFTGVCGDARFINDFATAQAVQALLDMAELTGEARYDDAALRTARMYTASIYTHPMPSDRSVEYKGNILQEWQISQVGLCFEHGGCAGSAVKSGPILLTSHCGLFVRLYEKTGDRFFLNLARAAATAREAHLAPDTHIATYYWSQFDRGPGPFPHHAWWQLGWIADYIYAEAEMRSGGCIRFPRGFMTPKVGPQRIFGFEPGSIYGVAANPVLVKGLFETDNTDIEALTARSVDGKALYLILLNSTSREQRVRLILRPGALTDRRIETGSCTDPATGRIYGAVEAGQFDVSLPDYGIRTLKFDLEL